MRGIHGVLWAGLALAAVARAEGAPTYWEHIAPIVETRCVGCHNAGDVAFPLDSEAAVYERRSFVVNAVTRGRMLPWLAAPGVQTYKDDASLSDEQRALFDGWRAAGFPRGNPEDKPAPVPPIFYDIDPDVAVTVPPDGAAYLPSQTEADDYRCFLVEWPEALGGNKYLTGFQAVPGNRAVVHHLVAYQLDRALLGALRQLDREEEGLGYRCFGGAMPDRLADPRVRARIEAAYPEAAGKLTGSHAWWLGHWAPGMKGQRLPAGTGIALQKPGFLVVQVHYYSRTAPGQADSGTRVLMEVSEDVTKPGFVVPFTNDAWLFARQNRSLVVPPYGETTVRHTMALSHVAAYGAQMAGVPLRDVKAVEVHSANLHMHSYGASARAFLDRGAAGREVLLEMPRWDLRWQRDFTLVEPKVFPMATASNVRFGVECTFENPTAEEVFGGFGSDEEMCFNFGFVALDLGR